MIWQLIHFFWKFCAITCVILSRHIKTHSQLFVCQSIIVMFPAWPRVAPWPRRKVYCRNSNCAMPSRKVYCHNSSCAMASEEVYCHNLSCAMASEESLLSQFELCHGVLNFSVSGTQTQDSTIEDFGANHLHTLAVFSSSPFLKNVTYTRKQYFQLSCRNFEKVKMKPLSTSKWLLKKVGFS